VILKRSREGYKSAVDHCQSAPGCNCLVLPLSHQAVVDSNKKISNLEKFECSHSSLQRVYLLLCLPPEAFRHPSHCDIPPAQRALTAPFASPSALGRYQVSVNGVFAVAKEVIPFALIL
jgi:hypothetical protein